MGGRGGGRDLHLWHCIGVFVLGVWFSTLEGGLALGYILGVSGCNQSRCHTYHLSLGGSKLLKFQLLLSIYRLGLRAGASQLRFMQMPSGFHNSRLLHVHVAMHSQECINI